MQGQLPLLLILFSTGSIVRFTASLDTFHAAKSVVSFLEKKPPKTEDPITEITRFLDKILDLVFFGKVLNGDATTNQGRVEVPGRAKRPALQDTVFYYHYPLAGTCESNLETWDCPYCKILGSHIQLIKIIVNPTYHSKSFITLDHKRREIVLTFRPAYNLGGFLVGLSAKPEPLSINDQSGVKIHSGVLKSTQGDYDELLFILRHLTNLHPEYKVVITGYSFGGSQAAVMLFLLKYTNALPKTSFELYTYAGLRCGNKVWANYMNNLTVPIVRVVNVDDIAPRTNPAALGYFHHQPELFVTDGGYGNWTARFCSTEVYEDPSCAPSSGSFLLYSQILSLYAGHLVYFGIDPSKCFFQSPVEFFLQAIWPLRQYIPKAILEEFPQFSIKTNMVLDLKYLATAGIRNLYKVAGKSSTYYKRKQGY